MTERTTMRKYFLFALLISPLIAANSFASCSPAVLEQPFGYSSDDSGGASYLGVDTRDITPDRVAPLHLKDEVGVEVTMVDQDAPAGKAGIKEHDVITSVNGDHVESVEQLRRLIHEIPSGRTVTIGLSRNGEPLTIKAQLAARAQSFGFSGKDFHFEMPPMPAMPAMPAIAEMDLPVSVVVVHSAMRSGLMVENLTPQLGDFFGAKGGQGILVRSVEKGSLAEKAGFHAGDVIVRVNGESIADSGDFGRALRSRKDNNVTIGILRDKKATTITIALPARKESGQVMDESFDLPEISAETAVELSNLRTEVARVQPEINLAVDDASQVINVQVRKALAAEQKNFSNQKVILEKQKDLMRKGLKDQMRELHKQFGADI
jgi:membrane-associated protease RseP (regulator of RpoE activity)